MIMKPAGFPLLLAICLVLFGACSRDTRCRTLYSYRRKRSGDSSRDSNREWLWSRHYFTHIRLSQGAGHGSRSQRWQRHTGLGHQFSGQL
jgi:hypothetical protein